MITGAVIAIISRPTVAGGIELLINTVALAGAVKLEGKLWIRIVDVDKFDASFNAAIKIVGAAGGINAGLDAFKIN